MAALKPPWRIPRLWPDSTVYIIGGGASIKEQNLDCLQDKRTIGANVAYRYYPWIDVVYFGDCSLYEKIHSDLLQFGGLKLTSCGRAPSDGWPGVKRIARGKASGIDDTRPDRISWNGCTGSSAINIAYWLGAKKIVLLGFDMCRIEGSKNFHEDYTHENPKYSPFSRHLRHFPIIAADAKKLGIEILNASPISAVTQFPLVKLEDTL